jgi:hypothetical protein
VVGLLTAALAAVLLAPMPAPSARGRSGAAAAEVQNGCVDCHAGIEAMHPWFELSCTDCHGGDASARDKERAHVPPTQPVPRDERVLPRNHDLPYLRFVNPSNLRVADQVCGDCHGDLVSHLEKSLHGTTTGHLSDGFYEHGISKQKHPNFSIFPVQDRDGRVGPNAIAATVQVPGFQARARDRIDTHYADLPRKACMQCHLWSEGRAIDGRLGLDGDYRGEGCAACHVTYDDDGRSRSGDPTIDKAEPGHPREHRLTSRIPTSTCTRCHYGDASIGLNYRGMAQLVPGQPAGPEVPGTTATLLNGTFYIQDPDLTPPDVHHARGMHCIDCHTLADTMGDGDIHPNMDFAVEIECTSCHGTIDRPSDLMTSRGRRVPNLHRDAQQQYWLISKVTGRRHPVKQARDVVDRTHPHFNARAAAAMTLQHQRLECYTCHSGWNPNFFGFHFDRNEQFTQLDLISGQRTPGRVTTQEKVFATFSQLRLGWNHEGMVAPYMVGFSTIGSAHDKDGQTVLHQSVPITASGLSGVSLIPHQVHTTRPEARTCVECHRNPVALGLGSANFRLARAFAFAVDAAGLWTIAIDPKTPARTMPVADLPLPGRPRALALVADPARMDATHALVAGDDGVLRTVSLRNPVAPRLAASSKKLLLDPRRMLAQGDRLYVADGAAGVQIFDLADPERPKPLGVLPTVEARGLALAYPWLLVADGPGGLVIADVADPAAPRVLATVDLNGESGQPNDAVDVTTLFQFSRPRAAGKDRITRTRPRHLAFVACGLDGLRIVDFTEPGQPLLLHGRSADRALRFDRGDVRGVAINTMFDLGSQGGGLKSQERDHLYAYAEVGRDGDRQQQLRVFDVTDPLQPRPVPRASPRIYGGTGQVRVVRIYNAPFLQQFALAPGAGGAGTLVDVSRPATGAQVAAVWDGINGLRDFALEEFAFDRLVDENGRWLKDISHANCRYLTRDELLAVLRAPVPVVADPTGRYGELRSPPPRREDR